MNRKILCALTLALGFSVHRSLAADPPPATALAPSRSPQTLKTPRSFPEIGSLAEWQARARDIREQALVSCGLWPMPRKTPLHARIFGRLERDGYTIEKVCLETIPGFYLGGNLYRPLGKGKGPFPGVLNPHGHWKEGRLTDTQDGSIPARCINFAKQGMVAFAYDMVGFNDTQFKDAPTNRPYYEIHRLFAKEPADQLWNISLMGLQTWNSIRALDFLESLPDVDPKRLAVTGGSGGGTQTFMLGAVDDRLAAQAPVVMVSHSMQGGCFCENAPGLRVEYSNMEIAASAAPRPQFLVASTGDWTKTTLTLEGPAIAGIYKLFNASDHFGFVRFDFGHNYNQTSREAVYAFFRKCLLHGTGPVRELPYQKERDEDLRVFPEGKLPPNALTERQLAAALKQRQQVQLHSLLPHSRSGFENFRATMLPAWRHTLQLSSAQPALGVQSGPLQSANGFSLRKLRVHSQAQDGVIETTLWSPQGRGATVSRKLVILSGPRVSTAESAPGPDPLAYALLGHGLSVLVVDKFSGTDVPDQFADFYTVYNRTRVQQRVRDLVTLCTVAIPDEQQRPLFFKPVLIGTGSAGPWSLLAAPAAAAVAADCHGVDTSDEQALLAPDLFCPGLLSVGGFDGVAALAAPHPILLLNATPRFGARAMHLAYQALGSPRRLQTTPACPSPEQLAQWVLALD